MKVLAFTMSEQEIYAIKRMSQCANDGISVDVPSIGQYIKSVPPRL